MSYDIVQGDLEPPMDITVTENGGVKDLSESGLTFSMRWLLPDGTVTTKNLGAFNLPLGQLRCNWTAGDTDQTGIHEGQVLITDSGGNIETFPSDGSPLYWWVNPQLGSCAD